MSRPHQSTEETALLVITIAIGAMAGAASFTHMHDWTMDNSPPNTPGWFGWANAVVSELMPTAAVLVIRRRRIHGESIGYPVTVLVASVALSLAAQFAQATPSISGWLLAAVPALGFLAMTKLVLGHTATSQAGRTDTQPTIAQADEPEPADQQPVFAPWAAAHNASRASLNGTPTHPVGERTSP